MKNFDLPCEIDRYASRICQDIRSGKKRREIKQEYVEHLEDATYRYMMRGMTDADAFGAACDALGDMAKMQTLLAVTHNGDGLPRWFPWLLGGGAFAGLWAGYCLTPDGFLRMWLGIALGMLAAVVCLLLLWEAALWLRAAVKRRSAKRRLGRLAADRGLTFTQHKNPYLSLLKRTATPEWVLDTDRRRYIIHLFPVVHTRRVLHLHESGLYTCPRRSLFLMRLVAGWTFAADFYQDETIELPRGTYRMPPARYDDFYGSDKENVHILLLNPIPRDADICVDGRIKRLFDGSRLPEKYGYAVVYSASGFLAYLEREKF